MKKLLYNLSLLLSLSMLSLHTYGESTDSTLIKRDVTIEKDYVPTIKDAGKINEIPSIIDAEIKQIDVSYSPYSVLLQPDYQIRKLESARLKMPVNLNRKEGYLRLGMGNRWATLADFMYPILNKPNYRLDINLNHNGIFSKMDKIDEKMHHDNKAGLSFNRYYENGELFINGGYGYEAFNYYGENFILAKYATSTFLNEIGSSFLGQEYLPQYANISRWDFALGYNSKLNDKEYSYNLSSKYNGFSTPIGLTEHTIDTKLFFDKKIDENKVGVDLKLLNLLYNSNNVQNELAQNNYAVFSLNPFFTFEQAKWWLRLGVKANFSKASEGVAFAPVADIEGQVSLVEKSIYAYGAITGDYQVNSMNYMETLNRYLNLNKKIKDTYTPFDIHGGFKLKLLYNFLIDLSVGYKTIKNQYFFVNNTITNTTINTPQFSNTFGVDYQDANLLNAGIRINYNFNQAFSFIIAGKYNSWKMPDTRTAWHMPKYEFDFGTDMKLTKRTTVNLYTYFASGRKAMAIDGSSQSLKTIADINLGFFYAHSSKVAVFVKLNNLLNSHYQTWNGYEVIGFNGLLGLTFSF